ncbi:amidohydrolase [Aquimarina sp. AD1]|uniref:amidohydrolase family protein n=1 Tax=Aquimarina sp. (strain AD1) TaxID=1714848 RepID=UPI000E557DFC|nr:amidohydrolase family protein [Aquimarina sp. AD1]AXT54227.1 amidohydrolase [Aquimarina sp. AD1]RKN25089.1 amidohydrolase [Aquimarina sp. AD1]
MKTLIHLIIIFFIGLLNAQESFIIRDVTIFDGDKVIPKTSILVENGTISKVAKSINHKTTVIDGNGKFLMPAMTNCHVHAWGVPILQQAAGAGVFNLLDMHGVEPYQGMMKTYRDSTNYARFFVAGYAATAPEGHGTQYGFPVPTLNRPEDAIKYIADRVKAGVDHIKIIVEPWKPSLSHETVKAIIDEGHKNKKKVVVHVSKMNDGYQVLTNNADGLVHIWRDTPMPEEQLQQLAKEKDFFVIPTLLVSIEVQKKRRKKTAEEIEQIEAFLKKEVKRLYDAGIPILAGTDPPNVDINYGTDLYKELILMSEAGIPNKEVLKGATSLPADKFELGKIGYIKEGYIADLLLLDKNPIEDIKHINTMVSMWKAGKKVQTKK